MVGMYKHVSSWTLHGTFCVLTCHVVFMWLDGCYSGYGGTRETDGCCPSFGSLEAIIFCLFFRVFWLHLLVSLSRESCAFYFSNLFLHLLTVDTILGWLVGRRWCWKLGGIFEMGGRQWQIIEPKRQQNDKEWCHLAHSWTTSPPPPTCTWKMTYMWVSATLG